MKYFGMALELASQVMERTPTYDQGKKRKFYELKRAYNQAWDVDESERDHDLILNLKDELEVFLEAFVLEIRS